MLFCWLVQVSFDSELSRDLLEHGPVLDVLQGIAVLLDGFQAHRSGLVLHVAQGVAVLLDGFQAQIGGLARKVRE